MNYKKQTNKIVERVSSTRFAQGARTTRAIRRLLWLLGLLVVGLLPRGAHAAEPVCGDAKPDSGAYTVTFCFIEPEENGRLSGDVEVSVEISVEGDGPDVQRVVFYLDLDDENKNEDKKEDKKENKREYLLTEYDEPYNFVLPSASFSNGVHELSVEAFMRDKTTLQGPSIKVRFDNEKEEQSLGWPSWRVATAEPEPDEPLIVAAVGDGASGRTEMYDVVDLLTSWNPDLFFYLGDVYERSSPTEFYNWYDGLGDSYGRFREITNPVIGNHEYIYKNKDGAGYFDYWGGVPDYYSFDSGGWHFVALNSNCSRVELDVEGGCNPDSPQFQWLAEDLAANQNACTIVYFHHPVFSIGSHGDKTQLSDMWTLLVQQRVDLVLTGHDHNYQRWKPLNAQGEPDPEGVTQFVVGSGGHGVRGFEYSDERVAKGEDDRKGGFGALQLELYESGASYKFINTAGEVRDEGQVRCNQPHKSALTPIPLLAYYNIDFDQTLWDSLSDRSQLGRYSSDDLDVMRQHIRLAKSAGITGFIVNWHDTQQLNLRLEKLLDVAENESFKLAIRYDRELKGSQAEQLQKMAKDVAEFISDYAHHPAFNEFERPLVILSDLANFSPEDVAAITAPLQKRLLLLSEGNLADYESLADIVDGHALHSTATFSVEELTALADTIHAQGGLWIPPASTGGEVWLIGEGSDAEMEAEPRTAQTLRKQMNLAIQSAPDAIGLISWNDFAADTQIEPSQAYGTSTLDVLRDIYAIQVPGIPDFDSNAPAATNQPPLDYLRLAAMGILVILVLISGVVVVLRSYPKKLPWQSQE